MSMRWFVIVCVCVIVCVIGSVAQAAPPAATAPASRPTPLGAGNHRRDLTVDGRARSYLVHVPPAYDARKPTPVVLAFHGAGMNAAMMVGFSGLDAKADAAGFVAVYPNGLGFGEAALFFNAWGVPGPVGVGPADDVAFTARLLDDLATVLTVDPKRVFATGMSNGGMMCHRLAAELPDRIAAIAPVGGTIAAPQFKPGRPVPVMHFHGTADRIVPWDGPGANPPPWLRYKSVGETVAAWVEANHCAAEPKVTEIPDLARDGTTVRWKQYAPGKDGADLVLIEVTGGGHTWPGRQPPVAMLGKSTANVSANDLMWGFFLKHPMK